MRELPRQLSVDELAELFSARTRLVEVLAERDDPLTVAPQVVRELSPEDRAAALAAHPRIGERSAEQHGDDPAVLAELAELNRAYEEKFGFVFLICASGKTTDEILASLRRRLEARPEEELAAAAEEQRKITRLRLEKMLT